MTYLTMCFWEACGDLNFGLRKPLNTQNSAQFGDFWKTSMLIVQTMEIWLVQFQRGGIFFESGKSGKESMRTINIFN